MRGSILASVFFMSASAAALDCAPTAFISAKLPADVTVHVKVHKVYKKKGMDVRLVSNLSNLSIPGKFHIDYSAVALWDGDLFPENSEWLLHLNSPAEKSNKYVLPLCIPSLRVSNGIAMGWITGAEPNGNQEFQLKEIKTMVLELRSKQ